MEWLVQFMQLVRNSGSRVAYPLVVCHWQFGVSIIMFDVFVSPTPRGIYLNANQNGD